MKEIDNLRDRAFEAILADLSDRNEKGWPRLKALAAVHNAIPQGPGCSRTSGSGDNQGGDDDV